MATYETTTCHTCVHVRACVRMCARVCACAYVNKKKAQCYGFLLTPHSISILVFRNSRVQKFLSTSLVDFSANLGPKSMIFDSVDSPLIFFLNTSNFLISHHTSLFDFIKF